MRMVTHHKHLFSLVSLLYVLLLWGQYLGLEAEARNLQNPTKLFVFGDSYVDTGNTWKNISKSWKVPYGITFPGKPTGRFSDGTLFTDYFAKYLGVRSPVPYKFRKTMRKYLKLGMNFGYGGTGVFDTSYPYPNMTVQIDLFQSLINHKHYTSRHLSNSIALVSVAGNDYSYYLATNGTLQGFPGFIASVVNQTIKNVERIHGLGVKKIVINGLQPLGCVPQITVESSYTKCNSSLNSLVALHNTLLTQAVAQLNQNGNDNSTFVVLDLYDPFMSLLNQTKIEKQLKPCCVGVSSEYSCGSVDNNNVKKYSVCEDRKSAFFWDSVHPTQAGWNVVFQKLQATNAFQQISHAV